MILQRTSCKDRVESGRTIRRTYRNQKSAIKSSKVFPEAKYRKDVSKDVLVGASVWNDKKKDGSHILSLKRDEEGDRGIYTLLSGVQCRKRTPLF